MALPDSPLWNYSKNLSIKRPRLELCLWACVFYINLFCVFGSKACPKIGFPSGKNSPANAGDERGTDSIPGLGRSPGEEMATCSSILAWRIPRTEEFGKLQSTGPQRVGLDWATMHALMPEGDCFFSSHHLSSWKVSMEHSSFGKQGKPVPLYYCCTTGNHSNKTGINYWSMKRQWISYASC